MSPAEAIKQHIANDEIADAIKLLVDSTSFDKSLHKIALSLSYRFQRNIKRRLRTGSLQNDDMNSIVSDLIDTVSSEQFKNSILKNENYLQDSAQVVKHKLCEVEITIEREFASYSDAHQEYLMRKICSILKMGISDIKIKQRLEGSVKLILDFPADKVKELQAIIDQGLLMQEHGVSSMRIIRDTNTLGEPNQHVTRISPTLQSPTSLEISQKANKGRNISKLKPNVNHIELDHYFEQFYWERPPAVQTLIDYVLEWILASTYFPTPNARISKDFPTLVEIAVPLGKSPPLILLGALAKGDILYLCLGFDSVKRRDSYFEKALDLYQAFIDNHHPHSSPPEPFFRTPEIQYGPDAISHLEDKYGAPHSASRKYFHEAATNLELKWKRQHHPSWIKRIYLPLLKAFILPFQKNKWISQRLERIQKISDLRYKYVVGKFGTTKTGLSPKGVIIVGGKEYTAKAQSAEIAPQTHIYVLGEGDKMGELVVMQAQA